MANEGSVLEFEPRMLLSRVERLSREPTRRPGGSVSLSSAPSPGHRITKLKIGKNGTKYF